ncbi:MAG: hypothetical protein IJB86_06075 [Clostridia bacterium]|nr:hypothetical protein [Clostridia bacterium]
MNNSKSIRFFAITIALIVALSSLLVSVSGADGVTVSVAGGKGKAGDTVTVSVDLSQNPGLTAMKLHLTFDSNQLEIVSQSDTGKLAGNSSHKEFYSGEHTLYWVDSFADENNTSTGTIATLTFKLKEDCTSAAISVSGEAYDKDLNSLNVSASGGTITNTEAKSTTTPSSTQAANPSSTPASSTKAPTTKAPTTTKKSTSSTTKRASTTRNNVVTFEEETTTELESTTDFLSLFETTTEEFTETTTEETTTELVEEEKGTLSRTQIVLIILMACLGIVGIAIIVSMVRKTKRG